MDEEEQYQKLRGAYGGRVWKEKKESEEKKKDTQEKSREEFERRKKKRGSLMCVTLFKVYDSLYLFIYFYLIIINDLI